MSTSDMNNWIKALTFSVLSILFTFIYERFSYGQYAWTMRALFSIPLIYQCIVYILKPKVVTRFLLSLSAGILYSGCLVTGIITISGRSSSLSNLYWVSTLFFGFIGLFSYYKEKQS